MNDNKLPWQHRYAAAHYQFQLKNTPNAVKDHGYLKTKLPDIETANGLQKAIKDFCLWSGHYCNRINSQGQVRVEKIKLAHGNKRTNVKWTKGQTIEGTADLDINLKHILFPFGIPVKAEVKIKKDRQSDDQKDFEQMVSKTGAVYVIIKTIDQWFAFYDSIITNPRDFIPL